MEKEFNSWLRHQHSDWKPPDFNKLGSPFNLGQQNATVPVFMSPCANVILPNTALPGFPFSGFPHMKVNQPSEQYDWFHRLPCFGETFAPELNSISKVKIPVGPRKDRENVIAPELASSCAQKRFLVFDQSGDKTTLILSPGIGTPVPCPSLLGPKLKGSYDLNKIKLQTGRDSFNCLEPNLTDESNENQRDDMGSEMHEDTEELNALLYSDDDDEEENFSEDDEVASTGHSPSTMTAYDKDEPFEEVASSGGPTKRMKLCHGGYAVPSLMDTASCVKPKQFFDHEDDAESCCGDWKNCHLEESRSFSGNKRSRKDKIRETVSVLRNIIPGGEGKKDAVVVIDEAISYLRSLKHKAMALGVVDIL